MQKKLNDKGMSLLELVIAMAISIIITIMIVSFISAAFRVFQRTNNQVKLQMEAQTSMNQLVNLVAEAKGVSEAVIILTDQDIRYGIDNLDGYSDYTVIWRRDYQKLYLVEMPVADSKPEDISFDSEANYDKEYLMAEYVDDFAITSDIDNPDLKSITIHMVLGREEYEVSREVSLRNAK